ncbi:MAG: hypothetical protein MK066_06070 [Crocinitomicaceae bacterium]|nr:hypothetical protein [Crocinitomicaceae bacterium]
MRYLLLFSTILVLASSCKKQDTVWETNWGAPIISDTLSLENLVNDSTLSVTGSSYAVDLNRTLFNVKISEFVSIPDTVIEEQLTIPFPFMNIAAGNPFVTSEEEHNLNLPNVELKEIRLSHGVIEVEVKNPVETITIFDLKLPGVTKDGVEFVEVIQAPAAVGGIPGVITKSIDVSGYKFDLTGIDGYGRNILRSQINVKTDPYGPDITLTNYQVTNLKAEFRDILVDYAKGYFGNQILSDTTEVMLDVMNMMHSGMVDIPSSTIKFGIENGMKVGAQALLTTVSNESNVGSVVDLVHPQIGTPFNIDPALGAWATLSPSLKTVQFDEVNSNVEAYLENLGVAHKIGYVIELNPWGNISAGTDQIFPNSALRVLLEANMPLAIGLDQLVVQDTFPVDLSQDVSTTHVKSGKLLLKTSNAFPFSANVQLVLLDAQKQPLHVISGTEPIASSLGGVLESASNLMVANSDLEFVLTEGIVADVNQVKYILIRSEFNSTNSVTGLTEQMTIPYGAYLSVRLQTRFISENRF